MKIYKKNTGFTLIEIIVAITIFSMMMISVIDIFIYSSDVVNRSDINRSMQINLKNLVETISEDIKKNGLSGSGVSSAPTDRDCFNGGQVIGKFQLGDKLCTKDNKYYLDLNGSRVDLTGTSCLSLESDCRIVKNGLPITNSFVSVKSLKFYLSNDPVKKVTIVMEMQPSAHKGVKSNLIKDNKLFFQTTITERPF